MSDMTFSKRRNCYLQNKTGEKLVPTETQNPGFCTFHFVPSFMSSAQSDAMTVARVIEKFDELTEQALVHAE
jgi:hypothetical protein